MIMMNMMTNSRHFDPHSIGVTQQRGLYYFALKPARLLDPFITFELRVMFYIYSVHGSTPKLFEKDVQQSWPLQVARAKQ